MNRKPLLAAFSLGLAVLLWTGWGFWGHSALALLMTVLMAGVYLLGAHELRRFQQDSSALQAALADIPSPLAELQDWLTRVPPALRDSVRLRLEGERSGLPGPALTPYLVGLLVMLGMLGTFLGMVLTFQGSVLALDNATDLQAIRSALAAPFKGLGLAFGTSVAGVASSAMLGLMSTLCRRERQTLSRQLDHAVGHALRPFSRAQQRQAMLDAAQAQSALLPQVVAQLQAMAQGLEQRSQQLGQQLAQQQTDFHHEVRNAYTELASQVRHSLLDGLHSTATAASDGLRQGVQTAVTALSEHALDQQRQQADLLQDQLQQWGTQFQQGLQQQAQQFETGTAQLLQQLDTRLAQQHADQAAADQQRVQAWATTLQQGAEQLQARWQAHLADTTQSLAQVLQATQAVPQAAAQALDGLQHTVTQLQAREAGLQAERAQLTAQADAVARQVGEVAARAQASAIELAALGEAFGQGVQQYSASNDQLLLTLQRIESTLQRSIERSDQQLDYYVAQAREVIDLSITAQQAMLQDLQRLQRPDTPALAAGAAA